MQNQIVVAFDHNELRRPDGHEQSYVSTTTTLPHAVSFFSFLVSFMGEQIILSKALVFRCTKYKLEHLEVWAPM